jgi:hypothetical protein
MQTLGCPQNRVNSTVAVGLIAQARQRRLHLACLQHDHPNSLAPQTRRQPGSQIARLECEPLDALREVPDRICDLLDFRSHYSLQANHA